MVLLLAKAAGCSWTTARELLLRYVANRGLNAEDMNRSFERYKKLSQETAIVDHPKKQKILGNLHANGEGLAFGKPFGSREQADLEQADDLALRVDVDRVGGRHLWKARHGHDLAADRHNELRASRETHFSHIDRVIGWRSLGVGIGRERILGLGNANRQFAITHFFPALELVLD